MDQRRKPALKPIWLVSAAASSEKNKIMNFYEDYHHQL